jgi:hypothetical protein
MYARLWLALTDALRDWTTDPAARHANGPTQHATCTHPGCDAQTIATIEAESPYPSPDVLCPEHTETGLLWWNNGARHLEPPRPITTAEAARISWDSRGQWLTCQRCRGIRGPVTVLTWAAHEPDHQAQGWCPRCWEDLQPGTDLTGLDITGVLPLDQPSAAVDLHEARARSRRVQAQHR